MKTTFATIIFAAIAMTASGAEQLNFATQNPIVVGKQTLPAGDYTVARNELHGFLFLENRMNRARVVIPLPVVDDAPRRATKPTITLSCTANAYRVFEISGLTKGKAYRAFGPPTGEIVAITLRGANAD
ncbi:MAG: hypothetical protein ACK6DX_07420 [Acidobacteriota bacterium]